MLKKVFLVIVIVLFTFINVNAETIKVGTNAEYKPAEFYDNNGKLIGFDIDLMTAITKKVGLEIEWVDMQFDGLIVAVQTNKIDAIIAAMIANPQRKKQIDFTDTYMMDEKDDSESIFVVLNKSKINNVNDLKGKTIAVQGGTFQNDYVAEYMKDSKLQAITDNTNLYIMLEAGKVDAIMVGGENGLLVYIKDKNLSKDTFKILKEKVENPKTAIGVKKGNKELLDKLDKGMAEIKKSGEYKQIQDKWIKYVKE